jgi:ankyrin repeat protein
MEKSYKPRPPMPRYESKYHVPEKKIPEDKINKLFNEIILKGNLFEIQDFINQNNLTLNVRDTDGQSPLHVLFNNPSLLPIEKKQLTEFLISRGAPVNVFDKNNVTPIHLACKFQLNDIVNILLKNNADLNVQDNSNLTPLHYALIGFEIDCPEKFELKKDFNNKSITIQENINKIINDHFKDDILQYLNLAQDFIYNLDKYENELLEEKFKNLSEIINQKLSDPNPNISDFERKKSIESTLQSKIKDLADAIFNKNQENLKLADKKNILINFDDKIKILKTKYFQEILKKVINISSNLEEFKKNKDYVDDWFQDKDNDLKNQLNLEPTTRISFPNFYLYTYSINKEVTIKDFYKIFIYILSKHQENIGNYLQQLINILSPKEEEEEKEENSLYLVLNKIIPFLFISHMEILLNILYFNNKNKVIINQYQNNQHNQQFVQFCYEFEDINKNFFKFILMNIKLINEIIKNFSEFNYINLIELFNKDSDELELKNIYLGKIDNLLYEELDENLEIDKFISENQINFNIGSYIDIIDKNIKNIKNIKNKIINIFAKEKDNKVTYYYDENISEEAFDSESVSSTKSEPIESLRSPVSKEKKTSSAPAKLSSATGSTSQLAPTPKSPAIATGTSPIPSPPPETPDDLGAISPIPSPPEVAGDFTVSPTVSPSSKSPAQVTHDDLNEQKETEEQIKQKIDIMEKSHQENIRFSKVFKENFENLLKKNAEKFTSNIQSAREKTNDTSKSVETSVQLPPAVNKPPIPILWPSPANSPLISPLNEEAQNVSKSADSFKTASPISGEGTPKISPLNQSPRQHSLFKYNVFKEHGAEERKSPSLGGGGNENQILKPFIRLSFDNNNIFDLNFDDYNYDITEQDFNSGLFLSDIINSYKLEIKKSEKINKTGILEKDKELENLLISKYFTFFMPSIKHIVWNKISKSYKNDKEKNIMGNVYSYVFDSFIKENIYIYAKQYIYNKLKNKTTDEIKPPKTSIEILEYLLKDRTKLPEINDLLKKIDISGEDINDALKYNIYDLEILDKNIIKKDRFSFFNDSTVGNRCVKIDPELLEILIKSNKKINYNLRDNAGNIPLYYAIDQLNLKAIELLREKYGDLKKIKNKIGETPIEYGKRLFKLKDEKIDYEFTKNIINKYKPKYLNTLPYKYLPKYSENTFSILMSLINQNFYLLQKEESDNWTNQDTDKIYKILNIEVKDELFDKFNLYEDKKQILEKILEQEKEKLKKIKEKEKQQEKINKIEEYILKMQKEQTIKFEELKTIGKIYNFIIENNYIKNLDKEYDVYTLQVLYNNYINSKKTNNKYNLHNQISNLEEIEDFDLVSKYYDNILIPYVRDYFELTRSSSKKENKALHEGLDMISIVYSINISTSIFNSILKVIESFTDSETRNKIINSSIIDESKITEYIFKDLPKNLTRVILKTYKDERDVLQRIESQKLNDHFKKINMYLYQSPEIGLNFQSPIIRAIEKEVYPYYEKLSELIIPQMKSFIDNYYRMILYEGKVIKINQILNNNKN